MSSTTNFTLAHSIDLDAICVDWMNEIDDQQTLQVCKNYMENKNISLVLKKCIAELGFYRPDNPNEFLYRYFEKLQENETNEKKENNNSDQVKNDFHNKEDNNSTNSGCNRTTKRESVYAESISEEEVMKYKPKVLPKNFKSMRIIQNAMQNMIRFSHLNDEEVVPIMDAVYSVTYSKGEHLIKAGDRRDRIFILYQGEVEVYRDDEMIKVLHEGHSYDETALIHPSVSDVTLTAKTDVIIWTIDRYTYRLTVIGGRLKRTEHYKKFLKQITIFEALNNECLTEIAEVVKTIKYNDGVTILNINTTRKNLFIIENGTAIIVQPKYGDIKPTEIRRLGPLDKFGNACLHVNDPNDAIVVAKGLTTCITINRDVLERYNITI